MSSSGPHQFVAFREQIERFAGLWQSIDARYSAVKVGDQWLNMMTDIRLSPSPPPADRTEVFVRLPRLVAGRDSREISALDQILRAVEANLVTLGDVTIRLVQATRQQDGSPTAYPYQPFFGIEPPGGGWRAFWDPERDSTTFALTGHGGGLQELIGQDLWREFERQLLVHTPPYFGFEDFLRFSVRATDPVNLNGAARFTVRAPVFSWVDNQVLDERSNLVTRVRCPETVEAGSIRLVARAGDEGGAIARFDNHGEVSEVIDGERFVTMVMPVEGLAWIQGALILRDTKIDEFVFTLPLASSPNPRYEAMYITDVGERNLRQFTAGNPAASRSENAQLVGLSWLLQLCGFQVLVSGLPGLNMGSAPDLLAFVPLAQAVVIIEATSRDLASDGKLVKLHDRAGALAGRLPGFDVLAVAATSKPSVTPPELELARTLNVRIMTQSELENLRQLAERNETPSRVFAHLKSLPRRG